MSMARSNSVTPWFPCSLMTDETGGSSFSLLGHLLALRTSSLFPMSQGAAKGNELARSVLLAQSRPILGDKLFQGLRLILYQAFRAAKRLVVHRFNYQNPI